jgi:hypothetical protein
MIVGDLVRLSMRGRSSLGGWRRMTDDIGVITDLCDRNSNVVWVYWLQDQRKVRTDRDFLETVKNCP